MLRILGIAFLGLGALAAAPSLRAQPTSSATLYVADLRSSDVAAIVLGNHPAVHRVGVALDPHEFTTDGSVVWVSNYRSASVTVLGHNGDRALPIPVAGEPHGLARLGSVVAVTQGRLGSVALLNAGTGALLAEVATGGEPHIVIAAGDRFYAADAQRGLVLAIDPISASVVGSVRVGDEPEALALSPDGTTLAVANARSHSISLLQLPELVEATRLAVPGMPVRSAFSPDGRTLAVSLNDAEAVLLQDLSSSSHTIVRVGRLPDGLAYTPDGRSLYVALSGEDHVAEIDVHAGRVRRLIKVGDGPSGLLLVTARQVSKR